jgi:hypothetical protein
MSNMENVSALAEAIFAFSCMPKTEGDATRGRVSI